MAVARRVIDDIGAVTAHPGAVVGVVQGMGILDHVARAVSIPVVKKCSARRSQPRRSPQALAVQRTDSALRLNVHMHALVLDGVYVHASDDPRSPLEFRELDTPTHADSEPSPT